MWSVSFISKIKLAFFVLKFKALFVQITVKKIEGHEAILSDLMYAMHSCKACPTLVIITKSIPNY